jgi:hypothetical protein
MAAIPQEVETLTPNEAISCLWNQKAAERCKIGLSDVVRLFIVSYLTYLTYFFMIYLFPNFAAVH